MGPGRIVLLVFGIFFVLLSFALMALGGAVLAVDRTFKDDQGFYSTGSMPVSASSSAIITHPADIRVEPIWLINNRNPLTIKVTAASANPDKQVFIGIASEPDLKKYLNEVSSFEVTGFSFRPYRIDFLHRPGNIIPDAPATQSFWVASAVGEGTQTLVWEVTSGSYSVVLMNSDGSSPVNLDVTLGARVPELFYGTGANFFFGGIIVLLAGGLMTFFAVRGWKFRSVHLPVKYSR